MVTIVSEATAEIVEVTNSLMGLQMQIISPTTEMVVVMIAIMVEEIILQEVVVMATAMVETTSSAREQITIKSEMMVAWIIS